MGVIHPPAVIVSAPHGCFWKSQLLSEPANNLLKLLLEVKPPASLHWRASPESWLPTPVKKTSRLVHTPAWHFALLLLQQRHCDFKKVREVMLTSWPSSLFGLSNWKEMSANQTPTRSSFFFLPSPTPRRVSGQKLFRAVKLPGEGEHFSWWSATVAAKSTFHQQSQPIKSWHEDELQCKGQ